MADKDIAPELLKKLQEDFKKKFDGNREIAGLYEKVSADTATYAEAAEFSQRTGEILAEVFGKDIKEELLPDGKMYYNIAQRTVRPMLENNYNLVADICEQVQTALNKQAGIGIKAMRPKLNDDRIKGIVNRLSSEEEYGKVAWILNAPVKTFSQSVVDDSIKENMDFQGKAGLYPRIERRTAGNCCPWCEAVAGSYRYPDVPKDVYRRHNNCLCSVDYDPGSGLMRGKTQNVHSKNWESEEQRQERIERAKQEYDFEKENEQKKRTERIELNKSQSQEYRHERDPEKRTEVKTSKGVINASQVKGSPHGIYLSDKLEIKPRFLQKIENMLSEFLEILGTEGKEIPKIVLVSDQELNKAGGLYNPYFNILLSQVFPKDEKEQRWTLLHELYHWDDAQYYKKKWKNIPEDYKKILDEKGKKIIDKLGINVNNVNMISDYAQEMWGEEKDKHFNEVYTEYRVYKYMNGGDTSGLFVDNSDRRN